eukprot:460868_1
MSITTPRKKDEVECTICHKTQQYRSIDSHWAFEYRTHPSDTQHSLRYTAINNEDMWMKDEALKELNYSKQEVLQQSRIIKQRLFTIVATGEFIKIHQKLHKYSKKHMSYEWQEYNTVLYLLLKAPKVYDNCQQFCYFSLFLMCMQAPEARSEGAFSTLKKLLSLNSQISIQDINGKFRIFSYFQSEFSVKCDDFLHKIAKEFLKEERSPYTSTTIKKKGSVLDRLLDDETLNIGVNIDFDEGDAYSESDEEQEDKRENEGETEQDALINICDMLSNGDDGDILSDGEMVGNIQSNIEHDEKMMELKDITEKKQRKRKINVLDDTNEPINMDKKRRKISSSKSNDVDNKQRIRRSQMIIPSQVFSTQEITNVFEILSNFFRINRTGQINKNKVLQQIQKNDVDFGGNKLEHILKRLHEQNKIFYIDPMVHQL